MRVHPPTRIAPWSNTLGIYAKPLFMFRCNRNRQMECRPMRWRLPLKLQSCQHLSKPSKIWWRIVLQVTCLTKTFSAVQGKILQRLPRSIWWSLKEIWNFFHPTLTYLHETQKTQKSFSYWTNWYCYTIGGWFSPRQTPTKSHAMAISPSPTEIRIL